MHTWGMSGVFAPLRGSLRDRDYALTLSNNSRQVCTHRRGQDFTIAIIRLHSLKNPLSMHIWGGGVDDRDYPLTLSNNTHRVCTHGRLRSHLSAYTHKQHPSSMHIWVGSYRYLFILSNNSRQVCTHREDRG